MNHELKTESSNFESVITKEKKVQICENNEDYSVGDTLYLKEWDDASGAYTGRSCEATVTHILRDPCLVDGYVALSINLETVDMQRRIEPKTNASLFGRLGKAVILLIMPAVIIFMFFNYIEHFEEQHDSQRILPVTQASHGLQKSVIN